MSPQLPLASPDLDALRALLTARGQDVPGLLAGLWDGPWPAFVLDAKGQALLTNARLQGLMGEVSLKGQRLLPSGKAQELRLVVAGLVPDVRSRDVFVCGPPAMVDTVVASVRALGVPRSAIHTEELSLA